jgi:hypothetical protein
MGITYRIPEKEGENYTLYRIDLKDAAITIGSVPTLGEAIGLAETDAKDLI